VILAIDPGNTLSAFVLYDGGKLHDFGKVENDVLLDRLEHYRVATDELAIEMVACYGMAVGAEVFDTCVWIGRYVQAWCAFGGRVSRVYRKDVKLHLCGQTRAKDGNVRQALIDKYGGRAAIGRKASPGPLLGVAGDVWSALAVAVTYTETSQQPNLK
jgi:hypothetical protein